MNKKILLITGGLGYIGSHAVVAFEQQGYSTVIVDNLSNTDISVLSGIEKILGYTPEFYNCDLRDKNKLENIFKKYKFDGVLHFAGLKSVGESCKKVIEYFDNNVSGSITLFECMEKYQVKKIIFSSSATVYNYDNPIPYSEKMNTGKTLNPYANTKYNIENILKNLSEFSNLKSITLRYFNPIGTHESGLIGENPTGIPNNLLPFIMKVAIGEFKELKIFGNDYDTLDGTGVRDYIDINDLIDGHVKAYKYLGDNKSGLYENINLGVGKGTSVLELLNKCEEVIGKKIPYEIIGRRKGDLGEFYCDANKGGVLLGWKPKIDIKVSIKNAWNFYNCI